MPSAAFLFDRTGSMQTFTVLFMGLTAVLLQVTALREFVSVFSGNELDLGITLAVWLLAVGIGSFAGGKIRFPNAFGLSFLLIGLFSQPLLFLVHVIRPVLSLEPGETIPFLTTVVSTVIILTPFCLMIGMQFPLAVSFLGGRTAKAYGLEAIGAFLGGVLFTVLIAGRISAPTLVAALSLSNIALGAVLLKRKMLLALLVMPVLLSFGPERLHLLFNEEETERVSRTESRYGAIEVFRTRDQFNVFSSGRFQFAYPDLQNEEQKAHLALTLHPAPDRVLLIGGSPAVARELLKYPDTRVDFVEIDPEMVRVSRELLLPQDRSSLQDTRLAITTMDARRFVKQKEARYDMVVLNLPEPSTAAINRFYTIEFFREARAAMKQDGIIVFSLPASFGYVGKRLQIANGSVYHSLKKVFRHVEVSSEEYGVLAASDHAFGVDPEVLRDRYSRRKLDTEYFHQYLLDDAFAPLKVSAVKTRYERVVAVNTDARPAAYLYNLMVWAEMHGGRMLLSLPDHGSGILLAASLLIAGSVLVLRRRKRGAYYTVFMTGYSAMAISLVIILAYQAAFGYVYEMLGLLTATFMAGTAIGAYGTRSVGRPLPRLRKLEAATVLLLAVAPFALAHEFLYYLLNALVGISAGALFAVANQFLAEQDAAGVAGKLYAIDLAGSFLGALLTAVVFVPLFGIHNTILLVVVWKIISLVLLFSIREESSMV